MSFFKFLYFHVLTNSRLEGFELCARKYKKLKNDIFYILPYVISTLATELVDDRCLLESTLLIRHIL